MATVAKYFVDLYGDGEDLCWLFPLRPEDEWIWMLHPHDLVVEIHSD